MINEINSLISIRNYLFNSINNYNLEKSIIKYMQQMLVLTDKKIITLLSSDKFKDYINFETMQTSMEEVAKVTNIKSGLKK